MNANQKVAIFIGAACLAILLVLHSPWTGYYAEEHSDLAEWMSWEPIVPWFGNVLNISFTTALVIGLTGLWCYLYRSKDQG